MTIIIKRLKHLADDRWLKCFKPRSPWDIAAYSGIKGKRTLGLGVENSNNIFILFYAIQKNCINQKEKFS